MDNRIDIFDSENLEYNAFVEKFKPKKTTDDCYTPPEIYDVIKNWACREYGIDETKIVRPFYPGGDYERYQYPEGAVVLDNPPFSILSKICDFFLAHEISFFLFAPSLTCLSGRKIVMQTNHIICDADITYENGAVVRTSFITSFGGDIVVQTAPELSRKINEKNEELIKQRTNPLPKYNYPLEVVTAAMMQKYAKYGIDFAVRRKDCAFVSGLDDQKKHKKAIFGGGLLLSERAAAERAAAERAAAITYELSDREREIVKRLG